jgi:hypothetical protein
MQKRFESRPSPKPSLKVEFRNTNAKDRELGEEVGGR